MKRKDAFALVIEMPLVAAVALAWAPTTDYWSLSIVPVWAMWSVYNG